MAAIQRQLQLARAMNADNTRVLVINRKGVHPPEVVKVEKIKTSGVYEGIEYIYASGTPVYPSNFLLRNSLKIIGKIGELLIVLYNLIFHDVQCLVINSLSLSELRYYYILSRIMRVQLVYDYVEFVSSLDDRTMKTSTGRQTFDDLFFKYTDSLIIISHFLEDHIRKAAPGLPYVIIPPIMDFEKFAAIENTPAETDYFLYCGSAHYLDVIEFIIEAYQKSHSSEQGVSLILVINGSPEELDTLKTSVRNNTHIKILSMLAYEALIGYYKNAKALLIPMQDNLQDKARFPFKISEYTAAARPIVTSNSGAVVDYFTDGVNALMAQTGDADDFATRLDFIVTNPEIAGQIGRKGYELGLKYFNYKSYSTALMSLIGQN